MADVLARILRAKIDEVEAGRAGTGTDVLRARCADLPPARDFAGALAAGPDDPPAVIAEIKRASPSAGSIREDFDPAAIGRAYAAGGAAALSVLTDRDFFQGDPGHLVAAREASGLPVLRKDFVIDPYQVYEARAMAADCILLIVAALGDAALRELHDLAVHLGMDVLVEVHDGEELDRALAIEPDLVGINNRDLHTFDTTLETTLALRERVPRDILLVTESGIHTREDVATLRNAGVHAFLVGEACMLAPDPGAKLAELFSA